MNEELERMQKTVYSSPRSVVNRIRDATTPAEAERLLRGFIDAHVAQKERENLQRILDANYAEELGTYDYDGIAQTIIELAALQHPKPDGEEK